MTGQLAPRAVAPPLPAQPHRHGRQPFGPARPHAAQHFPECCDPDGDGFGTLPNNAFNNPAPPGWFFLTPRATSSQLGTGDVLIQRFVNNGVEGEAAAMVPYVFATVAALASYDDGQGNAATVHYPVPATPGLGTPKDPYPVKAAPNGHAVVNLTFWRPQRKPIPPEPGPWTDIGKLSYTAQIDNQACPLSSFSTSDPNLVGQQVPQFVAGAGGVGDQAPDQPANPANTINFSLDITDCLAAHGQALQAGEAAHIAFGAWGDLTGQTLTETTVSFELQ